MKIKTIVSLITVATLLQTGVSAQAKFVEQESTITLNANGGYIGSGYMGTKTEIEMRKEILKRQYPPTFSNDKIAKLIQLLQELLKQTEVQQPTPQPTQTAATYIEGFGYVSQGNATQTTIGESSGDINKIVANME